MAQKLRKRVVRAMTDALLARDRVEMRAINRLLLPFEPPRRRRRATTRPINRRTSVR